MTHPDKVRLVNELTDEFLEFGQEYQELEKVLTTSDLQGVAQAKAQRILAILSK